ncbi:MAG: glycosyltransferase family 2 protein [Candidatus Sumerlaeaceae bacterium]
MSPPPQHIFLALPAYNEAENIEPLIREAVDVLRATGQPYKIIIVDDGSTDATPQILLQMAAEFPLLIETHEHNAGLGNAILTGISAVLQLSHSPDDVAVFMDADNTHSPKYVPQMTDRIWSNGYDVVIASRFQQGSQEVGVPLFRRFLSRGARLLFQVFLRLPEVRDYTCGYRAYRVGVLRDATEKFGSHLITRKGFACTDELLVRLSTLTKKMTEIPFVLRYDKKRNQSKLPLMKTVWETIKMLAQHR